jgi:tetratricopeptide (TPR) repeat protein
MTTTLIVRDAMLAINGAPEKRSEPREHLQLRIAEVAHMDERTAEECIEVLTSVANGEGADPDVLEALVIVALAHPALGKRLKLPTVATGRRLAAILERSNNIERTLAVFEVLQRHFSGHESLERDLSQLMCRQGMVQDLVNRYFERAKKLVREGRNNEAAGWLREVLQLDPGRKDAARMMRDLRFKRVKRSRRSSGSWRFIFVVALTALGLSYGVLREFRLSEEFRTMPQAAPGNLPALKRRLVDLEAFIASHPLWHGALLVLSERTALRVQLAVLEAKAEENREAAELAKRERLEAADLCRSRGMTCVQAGDLRGALAAFREALQHGGPEWPHHERVTRDVADLEASSTDSTDMP